MKKLSTIITFALLATTAFAQRNCGLETYTSNLTATNAKAAASISEAAQQINATLKNRNSHLLRDTSRNEIINIPVVIHVVYNTAAQNISDAQILSQITALNNDFSNNNADKTNRPSVFAGLAADAKIKFCIAQVDPSGKRTTGIIRKQTSITVFTINDGVKSNVSGGDNAWDAKKYLNIWICNLSGRTLGYAAPPGSPAELDGVVIAFDVFGTVGNLRPSFNKGRTATHEIGHWLGLKHIWGDTDCGDDQVDDTPRQRSYNYGCPSFPHVTECSQDANGDMFMNYMDFSDDACMNMFTAGQVKRMRAAFANGNARNGFLTSFACDSTLVQAAPTGTDTTAAAPEATAAKADEFKVFPNPVQSAMNIEYKAGTIATEKNFAVYNAMGVKVLTGVITKDKTTVSVAGLVAGMYIVRIGEGSNSYVTRLIKM